MIDQEEEAERPFLFEWLDVLGVAVARKQLRNGPAGVAILVALTSTGTTGRGAYVDASRLAVEVGVSERQVWRYLKDLISAGWFEQTHQPKRPKAGEKGQRAKYRLTFPALDLALVSADNPLTQVRMDMSHGRRGVAEPSDMSDPNRLTFSAQPSDTAEREAGALTPSVVTPSVVTPAHPSTLAEPQSAHAREPMSAHDGDHAHWTAGQEQSA